MYNPQESGLPKDKTKSKKKVAHQFKKVTAPKPSKSQAPPPSPIVNQLMEMGFARGNIEYAIDVCNCEYMYMYMYVYIIT